MSSEQFASSAEFNGAEEFTAPSHPMPQTTVQQGLPISVPVQPTGDARVDAALERLQELDQVPTSEQVEIYADIHQRLTAALGDTADAPETQGVS